MPRIDALPKDQTPENARPMLDAVEQKLGQVPNFFRTLAHAPAALEFYLKSGEIIGKGQLSGKLRERIALTIANQNGCEYCAAAHAAVGKQLGLSEDEVQISLRAEADDAKEAAALHFAKVVVEKRGWIQDSDLEAVRSAGWSDGAVLEIMVVTAINLFTNYVNHIAQTEVDFPKVAVEQDAI